ncbi:MAG TPA: hypothetical protein VGI10_25940 [Polyangiaceae bacterium]|jgi:hypothetical protein
MREFHVGICLFATMVLACQGAAPPIPGDQTMSGGSAGTSPQPGGAGGASGASGGAGQAGAGAAGAPAGGDAGSGAGGSVAGSPGAGGNSAGAPGAGGSVAGSSGAGGSTAGAGGTGGTPQVGCTSPLMIDDLEDQDTAICPNPARKGGWFIYSDVGVTQPPAGTNLKPVPISDRAGSSWAMSLSGSGLDGAGHAALLGVSVNGSGAYNAAQFSGLTFWAKSTNGASLTLRTTFSTLATQAPSGGGTCVATSTLTCGDDYYVTTALSPAWQQFNVFFGNGTGLHQAGWGVPEYLDLAHLLVIDFVFLSDDNGNKGSFGFEIDDVSFY